MDGAWGMMLCVQGASFLGLICCYCCHKNNQKYYLLSTQSRFMQYELFSLILLLKKIKLREVKQTVKNNTISQATEHRTQLFKSESQFLITNAILLVPHHTRNLFWSSDLGLGEGHSSLFWEEYLSDAPVEDSLWILPFPWSDSG